jgi:hypothetical protein
METYRKYLPHAAAVVLFALITLIYFRPLLGEKELRQEDIARHKGMSKEIADHRAQHGEEPLWTNSMFGGMPAYQISAKYPGNWLGPIDNAMKLWLPHPGGYLFLYCLGFFILLLCLRISPWISIIGALAYGLSSYFLIIIEAGHNSKANALGYLPALIGGVILLFNGWRWLGFSITAFFTALELNANHVQISYYGYILIGFLLAGYFIYMLKEGNLKKYFTALVLFIVATLIGLLPNAGNLLTTAEYGRYSTRGPSELSIKSTLKINKIGLDEEGGSKQVSLDNSPLKEHYEKNTTTGLDADYATQWSYGIGETFTFLIPDFKGGPSAAIQNAGGPNALKKVDPDYRQMVAGSNAYFGDQPFTSGPVYIGAIVVFLAVLGMFIVKHRIKWPLFLATVLTVALSWGNNFMELTSFFLHYVPGYNKFRAVSMILIVAELTLPLLAVLAIRDLVAANGMDQRIRLRLLKRDIKLKRVLYISAGITAGFCLIGYLAPDVVNNFQARGEEEELVQQYIRAGYPESEVRQNLSGFMPQLEIARKAIFRSDAIRSVIFIALAFAVIWLLLTRRIKQELFFLTIGFFIVVDLWTVDTRYLNAKSFVPKDMGMQEIVEKSAADEEILADKTPNFRVLNLDPSYWNEASTSYYHKSIGGYHGAKLKKIEELRQFHLDPEIKKFYKDAGKAIGSDSLRRQLLSSLQVINMLNTRYLILPGGEGSGEMALLNTEANGHAWFIRELIAVPDADDEILALGKISTKTQAVTREKFARENGLKERYNDSGRISLIGYKANQLNYEVNASEPGFVVFSEIYYPEGWNAYVDGKLQSHIPVNYVLRGMEVAAGIHKIEFRFEPATYKLGNSVALAGSILLLVASGLGVYLHRRNNVIVS